MPPFFSIIIPLYNKENFIRNTLKSVVDQSFVDFEIIIVNDGSTDGSLEIVEKFKDSRIRIFSQENQGVSAARNLGIAHSRGKFISFLDADDVWKDNFLETFHELIQKFPKFKVFSGAIEMDVFGKIIPAQYSVSNEVEKGIFVENYFKASRKFSILWTSCAVFHPSVFQGVGDFDLNIKSGQDTDLWIRIGAEFEIVFVNKILARYVADRQSLSRKLDFRVEPKIQYQKFKVLEKSNSDAKFFLDLNRFSDAVTLRLHHKNQLSKQILKDIDFKNLTFKKRVLLKSPSVFLSFFVKIQPILIKLGLRKTYFK